MPPHSHLSPQLPILGTVYTHCQWTADHYECPKTASLYHLLESWYSNSSGSTCRPPSSTQYLKTLKIESSKSRHGSNHIDA